MAPRSTTSATARSRPRCTAWCGSMPRPSSPRPRPPHQPTCHRTSKNEFDTFLECGIHGPWLPEASLRCPRPRQARRLQLPAPRVAARRAARAEWRRRRRTCWTTSSPCAGSAVCAVAADSAAPAAGRATKADDARAAGRAPRDCSVPARTGRREADAADSGAVTLIQLRRLPDKLHHEAREGFGGRRQRSAREAMHEDLTHEQRVDKRQHAQIPGLHERS